MTQYFIEPRTRKYQYGFLSFAWNISKKRRTVLDTASKNVFHETGEFLENKIFDVVA